MARQCKCSYCKEQINSNDALAYTDNNLKTPKKIKFCNEICLEGYITNQQSKIKEKKDYADLCEYIMKLHNKNYLPDYFFILLNDLRNGTIRKKGLMIKKEKEGVPWIDILNSYKFSEKTILWTIDNKKISEYINELKYCLAIVKSNIEKAKNQIKKKELENINVKEKDIIISNDYKYKSKEFKNDISDLL